MAVYQKFQGRWIFYGRLPRWKFAEMSYEGRETDCLGFLLYSHP